MTDVYVAGSLTHAPRAWWGIYERIGDIVEQFGLSAYVPHINIPKDINQPVEAILGSTNDLDGFLRDVFETDIARVEGAKLIIAEVSNPSTGVGVELGIALKVGKPIICLADKTATVTPFIMGAMQSGLMHLIRYDSQEDAMFQLKALLETNFDHLRVGL